MATGPGGTSTRASLGETLPASSYASGGVPAAREAAKVAGSTPESIQLGGTAIDRRIASLRGAPAETMDRFEVRRLIGAGANGLVYAVHDRDLDREVAVKVLRADATQRDEVDGFIAEARVAAGLDHPNVLPIHEVELTGDGHVYFTMKRIDGRSLADAISASAADRRDAAVSPARITSMAIALGHGVAYAHHRGIIHQDIKPDNVMIGSYGEVILVDWGSATKVDASDQRMYGTPLYMAPEQARLERVDARTDIYCMGATLLHALTLRVPMWSDDIDEFWRRKRLGELDPLTPAERRAVPTLLLDIVLKALAPDPQDRYPSADAFVQDLVRYQSGLSVGAHRDTWMETFGRWHRHHARTIWMSAAACMAIAVLGAALYGERLKQLATWRAPILTEEFRDDGWQRSWRTFKGSFERRGRGLVATDPTESLLDYLPRLQGDTAIEFTGEVLPGSRCGDISVFWYADRDASRQRGGDGTGEYKMQVGAFGNAYTAITGPGTTHFSYSPFKLAVGRGYRIRVEVVGATIRLLIDGAQVCAYTEREPFRGGWISLYSYHPGHAFRDLRIYARDVPRQVPAIAIGDAFLRNRLLDLAAREYADVAASHPRTAAAREALFKQGTCTLLMPTAGPDALAQADRIWRGIDGHEWDGDIALRRLEHAFEHGDRTAVADDLARLYRSSGADLRERVIIAWTKFTSRLAFGDMRARTGLVERYLAVHDELFPKAQIADRAACDALLTIGRHQQVLDQFPDQPQMVTRALVYLGRPQEVLERFPDEPTFCREALEAMGRVHEVRLLYPENPRAGLSIEAGDSEEILRLEPGNPSVLIFQGRLQEALDAPGLTEAQRALILLHLGRAQDIDDPAQKMSARYLLATGRFDEALREYGTSFTHAGWVRHAAGLEAYIAGDRERAFELFSIPPEDEFHQSRFALLHYVMAPFLREIAGDPGALARASRSVTDRWRWIYGQTAWYYARYLLGEIDDAAFLAQPLHALIGDDLAICRAVRAEVGGDADAALASYRSFLDIPSWRRSIESEPVIERFVRWRLQVLEQRGGAQP
jgi:predicted Ser/Thr protein kinase